MFSEAFQATAVLVADSTEKNTYHAIPLYFTLRSHIIHQDYMLQISQALRQRLQLAQKSVDKTHSFKTGLAGAKKADDT